MKIERNKKKSKMNVDKMAIAYFIGGLILITLGILFLVLMLA